MAKAFASSTDTVEKIETLEVVADGVYALTAEGDPNVGAIEGEDFLVCFDARATPASAYSWLKQLREHTDKPVKYLILSHYHAVRVLGASAFEAENILASTATAKLIQERGQEDWDSEYGRMPRLFKNPEEIPGLTIPNIVSDDYTIELGGDRGTLEIKFLGRGHTAGDLVAWHSKSKTLFAGDLVEAEAALYTGDAFHFDWAGKTLDGVKAFRAENVVGGRGAVAKGLEASDAAIEQTRSFINGMLEHVGNAHRNGGTVKDAFEATHKALEPQYGQWPIFEHCLPFDVQRVWDEYEGVEWPRVWTAERDREVWALLQG
ncbi:MAG: MBL fold metallo-hydrolase [Candidatus Pseudomonas phytovorans]|uniref:MBL fold metallo-hydrolase n=1 Tax=Candidatus Pseudomonas phytovorans TaxID=3121377 RepID=A0AAJ5WF02_9PSED|nr:MBL fold metallo-hydrolase [Pseudomonas sp.]WEK28502.1 MAG: MBL fold metallo-hydrolase [Pseudomonas sp.]